MGASLLPVFLTISSPGWQTGPRVPSPLTPSLGHTFPESGVPQLLCPLLLGPGSPHPQPPFQLLEHYSQGCFGVGWWRGGGNLSHPPSLQPPVTWSQNQDCNLFPPHSRPFLRQFTSTVNEHLLYAVPHRFEGAWKSQAAGSLVSQPHTWLESGSFFPASSPKDRGTS